VSQAISSIGGVDNVSVDFAGKRASVLAKKGTCTPKRTDQMIDALKKAGFRGTLVPAEPKPAPK
jgi:hypothetical protein